MSSGAVIRVAFPCYKIGVNIFCQLLYCELNIQVFLCLIVKAHHIYINSQQINECSQDRQLTSAVGWMLLHKPLWLGLKMNGHYTWMKLACWYCPQVRSCSYGKVCSFKSCRAYCDSTTWISEKLKVLQIWNKFLLSECWCI